MFFMSDDPYVRSGLYGIWGSVIDNDELGLIVFQRLKTFCKLVIPVVRWDDDAQVHELTTSAIGLPMTNRYFLSSLRIRTTS
jgi:hypothetical protein